MLLGGVRGNDTRGDYRRDFWPVGRTDVAVAWLRQGRSRETQTDLPTRTRIGAKIIIRSDAGAALAQDLSGGVAGAGER